MSVSTNHGATAVEGMRKETKRNLKNVNQTCSLSFKFAFTTIWQFYYEEN